MAPKRHPGKASAPPKKAKGKIKVTRNSAAAASTSSGLTIVTKLNDNDVLMGRGAMATDYGGNLRLRTIVQSRHCEFSGSTDRRRRQQIAEDIVQTVKDRGGRFLQSAETLKGVDASNLPRHEAAWYVVDDNSVLVAKVKQLFRDTKPPANNCPMRPNEECRQSDVLLTSANPSGGSAGEARLGLQALGLNFLMQQSVAPPTLSQLPTRPVVSQPSSSGPSSSGASQPTSHSPSLNASQVGDLSVHGESRGSTDDQHRVAISTSTSMLGNDNSDAILQAFTVANAPRNQEYDAFLALSRASRLYPTNSSAIAAHLQPSGPTRAESSAGHDMRILALANLLAESQRRERELNLTSAVLRQLLPQVASGPAATNVPTLPLPPPAPPPIASQQQQDPASMNWIFRQLQAQSQERSAATAAAAAAAAGGVAAALAAQSNVSTALAVPSQLLADFNVRGGQATSLESGLLHQRNRMLELERLLLPFHQWRMAGGGAGDNHLPASVQPLSGGRTSGVVAAAVPPATSEDGYAEMLRSLQRQYFAPPAP